MFKYQVKNRDLTYNKNVCLRRLRQHNQASTSKDSLQNLVLIKEILVLNTLCHVYRKDAVVVVGSVLAY